MLQRRGERLRLNTWRRVCVTDEMIYAVVENTQMSVKKI